MGFFQGLLIFIKGPDQSPTHNGIEPNLIYEGRRGIQGLFCVAYVNDDRSVVIYLLHGHRLSEYIYLFDY